MFNRYAYSVNDPVNNTDPSGECVPGLCPADIAMSSVAIKQDAGSFGKGMLRGFGQSLADTASVLQLGTAAGISQRMSGLPSASDYYAAAIGPAENVSMGIGDMQGQNAGNAAQAVGGTGAAKGLATATMKSIARSAPKGTPKNWIASPTKKGGGMRYTNPNNKHDFVRAMPGNSKSPNAAQQSPYVIRSKNGQIVNGQGGAASPKSPEAHIPRKDFKFD